MLNLNSVFGNSIFAIIGRDETELIIDKLPKDLAIITIADTNRESIDFSGFENVLSMKFLDLEEDFANYKVITDEQGKEIFDFIMNNKDKKFFVNCEAGISRSAGVGLAIEFLLRDFEFWENWSHFPSKVLSHQRYEPNMTVFNKIIQNHKGALWKI